MKMEDISARQDMNLVVSMKQLIRETNIIESIKHTAVANARITTQITMYERQGRSNDKR